MRPAKAVRWSFVKSVTGQHTVLAEKHQEGGGEEKKKQIAGDGETGIFFDLRPSIAIRRAEPVLCTINALCHLSTR